MSERFPLKLLCMSPFLLFLPSSHRDCQITFSWHYECQPLGDLPHCISFNMPSHPPSMCSCPSTCKIVWVSSHILRHSSPAINVALSFPLQSNVTLFSVYFAGSSSFNIPSGGLQVLILALLSVSALPTDHLVFIMPFISKTQHYNPTTHLPRLAYTVSQPHLNTSSSTCSKWTDVLPCSSALPLVLFHTSQDHHPPWTLKPEVIVSTVSLLNTTQTSPATPLQGVSLASTTFHPIHLVALSHCFQLICFLSFLFFF